MKIAFLVSSIDTERPDFTTTRLAMSATERGHETYYIDLDGITFEADDGCSAQARRTPDDPDVSYDVFLESIKSEECSERLDIGGLDVLMMRQEPETDVAERPWSHSLGVAFGDMAVRLGVIVLSDPTGFGRSVNNLYMNEFPAEIRPRTLITRDETEVKGFIEEVGGTAVLKPFMSAKGDSVFLVRPDEDANVNQMIEAVKQSGYICVQEYLPAASDGDVRLLLMNGDPIQIDGRYAAVKRTSPEGDLRSNISVGAEVEPATVDETVLEIAAAVKPILVRDGLFLVGLDIVGDKLIEINVTSPGTLTSSQWTTGVDYGDTVIEAVERKVEIARSDGNLSNRELATR